jgi:hypothetical protein
VLLGKGEGDDTAGLAGIDEGGAGDRRLERQVHLADAPRLKPEREVEDDSDVQVPHA